MKVYFLSSLPCALTLNGAYFGITDKFERFVELSLNDRIFAQFSPENSLPLGCFLTQELRFTPPDGFEVYLLPDGLALYARDFPPRDFTLKTYAQAREGNTLVTLFQQGELQLAIERDESLSVTPLPREFTSAKISFINSLIALTTPQKLALYTSDGACVFCENVLDYTVENDELNATMPLCDSLGRTANCRYLLTESGCQRLSFSLRQTRTQAGETATEKITEELLPFAFFESVLFGADYTPLLADGLLEKADSLTEFLGDFVAVVPTRNPKTCGLVKRKKERLYEVFHYTVEITDGKISDIRG